MNQYFKIYKEYIQGLLNEFGPLHQDELQDLLKFKGIKLSQDEIHWRLRYLYRLGYLTMAKDFTDRECYKNKQ